MSLKLHEKNEFRDRHYVFQDRFEAGRILAQMLEPKYKGATDALVLAIPSGGVPVGIEVSNRLDLPLDLAIARKIQIPGNMEAGFGAITLEGHVFLNEALIALLGLAPAAIEHQRRLAEQELFERNRLFRGGKPFPDLGEKIVILVDDGLASGYTMIASKHAAKSNGARAIVVAVPTAPLRSLKHIEFLGTETYCANVRDTAYFAVADAYKEWYDIEREEVLQLLGERAKHYNY
jgi:putative phosphoribosyl transferase